MKDEKIKKIRNFTKLDQLNKWLDDLIFPGRKNDFIQEIEGHSIPGKEVVRRLCFYTNHYQYFIKAIDRTEDEGYLGCGVNCRKARAGEDWTRGNDLPDGKFNKATWDLILKAIVSHELVKLSEYRKPQIGDIEDGNDIRKG
jgi:hypothetical protein